MSLVYRIRQREEIRIGSLHYAADEHKFHYWKSIVILGVRPCSLIRVLQPSDETSCLLLESDVGACRLLGSVGKFVSHDIASQSRRQERSHTALTISNQTYSRSCYRIKEVNLGENSFIGKEEIQMRQYGKKISWK